MWPPRRRQGESEAKDMSQKSKVKKQLREQKEEQQAKKIIMWIAVGLLAIAAFFLFSMM